MIPALLILMAVIISGCGVYFQSNPAGPVVLAEGDGIVITGQPGSVPPGVTLTIANVTEAEAEAAAAFTPSQIFFLGADFGPDGTVFTPPVTITFTLPMKLYPGWKLLFYRLENNAWVNTGLEATVNEDGLTASVQVSHFSTYVLFLDENWEEVTYGDYTLASVINGVPVSNIQDPIILVSGKTNDPAVIAKVMEVTGKTEEDAVYLLRSFDDTGDNIVQVLQLRQDVKTIRYWPDNPDEKYGRWLTVTEIDTLYSPEGAREYYALPNSNTSLNVTQYRLKPGAIVIYGVCADMTWSEIFGPYATGGGLQFYAPDATVWVGHAELNPDVIELETELRYVKSHVEP